MDNLAPTPQRTRNANQNHTNFPLIWEDKGNSLEFGTTVSFPLCEGGSLSLPFPWFLALNFTPTQDSPLFPSNKGTITFPPILQAPLVTLYLFFPFQAIAFKIISMFFASRSFPPIWGLIHRKVTSVHSTGTALAKITNDQLLDLRDSVQFLAHWTYFTFLKPFSPLTSVSSLSLVLLTPRLLSCLKHCSLLGSSPLYRSPTTAPASANTCSSSLLHETTTVVFLIPKPIMSLPYWEFSSASPAYKGWSLFLLLYPGLQETCPALSLFLLKGILCCSHSEKLARSWIRTKCDKY